jgi:hypothetical protein
VPFNSINKVIGPPSTETSDLITAKSGEAILIVERFLISVLPILRLAVERPGITVDGAFRCVAPPHTVKLIEPVNLVLRVVCQEGEPCHIAPKTCCFRATHYAESPGAWQDDIIFSLYSPSVVSQPVHYPVVRRRPNAQSPDLWHARAHLGCSPQVEFPGLGRKILPEAVMLFFAHDPEPCLFINVSGCVKNALCPERDLLISHLPRESEALLN